jgi:hypothetical protein
MTATITPLGSTKHGHWKVQCDQCPGIIGRPWQQLYPRRTIEGRVLAERARDEHNTTSHPETTQLR